MSTTTIGFTVSRVRNSMKAVKEDPFITDRYLWSLIIKYAKMFISRKDNINKLKKFRNLYKTIPCMDLIEVDKVEACCEGIKSDCIIMRTKEKIPKPFLGPGGPMFRYISSIDGYTKVHLTEPGQYTSMSKTSNFRFNKRKYTWYLNGHLYFPNIDWPKIKLEGIWEDDINSVACDASEKDKNCTIRQEMESNIPEDLFAEIEQQVLNEIYPMAQVPEDSADNKNNPYR